MKIELTIENLKYPILSKADIYSVESLRSQAYALNSRERGNEVVHPVKPLCNHAVALENNPCSFI